MVMPAMPIRECERTEGLYSIWRPRVMEPTPDAPRTVTINVEVPVFWVMVARNLAPVAGSTLIQPVAEGMLMPLPERPTVLLPMLAVPFICAPRTVAVLLIRFTGVVP